MNKSISALAVFALCCAWSPSGAASKQSDEDDPPIFYPPAPNVPRLQYLTKYSSAYDVSAGDSKLRDFVFGGQDKEEQVVQKPYGVAIHEGAIYVVDTRGAGYVVFDVANGKWRSVTGKGDGAMNKPINIAIDEDGTRYVTDTQREAVIVFDSKDRFLDAGRAGTVQAGRRRDIRRSPVRHRRRTPICSCTGQEHRRNAFYLWRSGQR